jgi:predicted ATPase/class 3 adenylate cyclase
MAMNARNLPTGTVTFLFTDVEGSTQLWERYPDEARSALVRHDRIIEENVDRNGGSVVRPRGEGDSRFAVFSGAINAVAAAAAMQQALHREPWPAPTPLRVRMALHTGEADLREGDYYGSTVNRCARLRAAAHGGQTLISQTTADLVRESLPVGVELRDLGEHMLRDLQLPERIFQLVAPGLPAAFPSLRAEATFFTNLPAEVGPFIGRQEELKTLCEQLLRTRLLTITGAGGAGKTRIALRLANEVGTGYRDGVALVELGTLSDSDMIEQTVASVFGVREDGDTSLRENLIYYLQRKTVLLVFDNCEHLLDACAGFLSVLLSKSSELKIIATSRERLGINGETTYSLPMLAVPDQPEKITVDGVQAYDAVELFVAEATNADSAFKVTEKNVVPIAELCKHLDGNALAIRLAASLTPTLSVDDMQKRLGERFDVLVFGRREEEPRHRTLKAAIDWSYELLGPQEATAFRRLAVFAGAWSLQAAEIVCSDREIARGKIVTILANLVRKNLIVKVAAGDDEPESRFSMLESVREYAGMRLRETKEVDRLRQEHAEYFVEFATRQAARLWGDEPQVGLSRLERDYDDLVSTLEWARNTKAGQESGLGLQLAAELGRFWERRGFITEGRYRLAQALRIKKRAEHERFRVEALEAAARLAFLQNDYAEAIALDEDSLKIRRRLAAKSGDTRLQQGVVGVLNKIGLAALRSGDYELAKERLSEALELGKEINHTRGVVSALGHLAELASRQGDYEEAKAHYEECLVCARRQKGRQKDTSTLEALSGQGRIAMVQGKYDEAMAAFRAGLDIRKTHRNKTELAYSHSDLSEVAFRKGDYEIAAMHAEESLRLRDESPSEWGIAKSLQLLAQAKHKLGLPSEALREAAESLAIFERIQYKKGIAECLMTIATIRLDLGEKETAAELFGAAESLLDSLGAQLAPDQRAYYDTAILAPARDRLDSRDWARGRNFDVQEGIQLAQA